MIFDFLDEHPILGAILIPTALLSILGLVFILLCCVHINFGEEIYTGYIYSAEDGIAQTTGHLRFSESAGMDEQPSFCVEKRDGEQLKELAGSGKKVRVTVPAGFTIQVPWVCAFPAKVEAME